MKLSDPKSATCHHYRGYQRRKSNTVPSDPRYVRGSRTLSVAITPVNGQLILDLTTKKHSLYGIKSNLVIRSTRKNHPGEPFTVQLDLCTVSTGTYNVGRWRHTCLDPKPGQRIFGTIRRWAQSNGSG